MAGLTINPDDFERAISLIFESPEFKESDFDKISNLLIQLGKTEWSVRPRTYAVLRMIDRVDLINHFVIEGLKDIALPYDANQLPHALKSHSVRFKFLEKQTLVLSKAVDLEKSDGRHRHFEQDADIYFDCLSLLGRGGFGEVHHIRSKLSREEYARKRVHRKKAFQGNKLAIKAFENEISSLKRLSHHHLVQFVGSYSDRKYIGLLMTPVADYDLKDFLNRTPFPEKEFPLLRGFYGCLCSALLYLHNHQCRHKDLKPANILVKDQTVMITDFGTARDWSNESRSTTTGHPGVYTPEYAAPEVIFQESRGSPADIWSLGCVYLEMMTVLTRKSLDEKTHFFESHGTGGRNPARNKEALDKWLEQAPSYYGEQQPVAWVRQMLIENPSSRLEAGALFNKITVYEGPHVYYNSCCNGQDQSDDDSSYRGSTFGEKIGIDRPMEGLEGTVPSLPVQRDHEEPASRLHREAVSKDTNDDETNKAMLTLEHGGFRVDSEYFNMNTAFLWASQGGYEAVVRLLVEKGADIQMKDEYGWTVLQFAARYGHEAVVQLLLDEGADIQARDENGCTALYWAARFGHEAMVQLLVEKGADFQVRDENGCTALHWAAKYGREAMVQLLVEKGADIHVKDEKGCTALDWAAENGQEAVLRLLMDEGLDVASMNANGRTALHWAAECGNEVVVQMLLEKGADIASTNTDGYTALHRAAEWGREAVVELLLEKGADIQEKDKIYGRTALHWAARWGHEVVVQLLLKKGADVQEKDKKNGRTALHLAARHGHEAVAQLLLETGADIAVVDLDGQTALHCAAENGHEAVMRLLLEKGADVAAVDNQRRTALQLVAPNGNQTVVQLLQPAEKVKNPTSRFRRFLRGKGRATSPGLPSP